MLKKRIFILWLVMMVVAMILSTTNVHAEVVNAFPQTVLDLKDEEDLRSFSERLKYLSEPELQEVIDCVKTASEEKFSMEIVAAKGAWLAAAQIARLSGYPLSATLVEHSVWNSDYSETNGNFADAIKTTDVYQRMVENGEGSDSFEKSDYVDLFYSIHSFSYYSSENSQGVRINVRDTFDFAFDTSYDSLFTSIVNNWAYLNQNVGVLNPIEVYIYLDE